MGGMAMGVRVREKGGHWYVFITHRTQRRAKKIGPGESGRRLALQVADRIRVRLAHGEDLDPPPPVINFASYAELWLQSVISLKKVGTWEVYQRHMHNIWIPAIGKYQLDQITRSHIKKVLIDLQRDRGYSRV